MHATKRGAGCLVLLPSNARAFLGQDAISFSELSSLSVCEKMWNLQYGTEKQPKDRGTGGMWLGTEFHRLYEHWWHTGEILPSEMPKADWLIDRYSRYYAGDRKNVRLLGTEIPFAVQLDWGPYLFGYLDSIFEVKRGEHRGLWVGECKTMDKWDRLKQLPVDMQVTLYGIAARMSGVPVRGVMFDAVRSFQWKVEHPLAESFERLWITRTEKQQDEAMAELRSATTVRQQLTAGERTPLRAIGAGCTRCRVKVACYDLAVEIISE